MRVSRKIPLPGASPSTRADAGSRTRSRSSSCAASSFSAPVSGVTLRKGNWLRSPAWEATKVPLPCWRTSTRSSANSLIALRTVPWLTL